MAPGPTEGKERVRKVSLTVVADQCFFVFQATDDPVGLMGSWIRHITVAQRHPLLFSGN